MSQKQPNAAAGAAVPAASKQRTAISPTREENYAEWYQQVVKAADLAEVSAVRGCMVIKPWGYAIWENIQRALDDRFKATGHRNAYFPLFIPLSYLQAEADHVEGFAKECAVVTHHRLAPGPDGKLVPTGELEEPLIVRPTSETIIGASFAKWVQSWRDLPLLINQWANVVRWEMRTRLFLRTAEFLWQEGHTAHATAEEAQAETMTMLGVYADFAEEWMAMPVLRGRKTDAERFPGAVDTYCIEAMMQDRKALQAGTSHFLGQNFAKSSGIQFAAQDGALQHAWTTSWGVSTRLVGGLVMTHADDDGLIVPPRLAPAHAVIIPILRDDGSAEKVMAFCRSLKADLEAQGFAGGSVRVELDDRDIRGGDKSWQWIKRGVPLRIEVGPRDVDGDALTVYRRDRGTKERETVARPAFVAGVSTLLDQMQKGMLAKARALRDAHSRCIDGREEFERYFEVPAGDAGAPTPIHAGFAWCHFCGDPAVEAEIKEKLGVTVRCIPLEDGQAPGGASGPGKCVWTGRESPQRVVFARAY